ncbi:MAG: FdtA/QdtA family cupin domain-containing protein [Flavobacteriaceae bacterium]
MKISSSSVNDCTVKKLSKIHNKAGNITIVENDINIPFHVNRIYYLYDIPGGSERGGHAHYELEQYVVAASGGFDVVLDDGKNRKKVSLNRPYEALHIVPGLWRELTNFSSGSICMVLASHKYDEKDYIRDYNEFLVNKL